MVYRLLSICMQVARRRKISVPQQSILVLCLQYPLLGGFGQDAPYLLGNGNDLRGVAHNHGSGVPWEHRYRLRNGFSHQGFQTIATGQMCMKLDVFLLVFL